MRNISKTWVQVENFRRRCLKRSVNVKFMSRVADTDLAILAAFEERGDSDEPDLIIPKNGVRLVIARDLEFVLEHCETVRDLVRLKENVRGSHVPSKASLPVFGRKSFLSLL